jgi:exodeoxyribonuclease VIII
VTGWKPEVTNAQHHAGDGKTSTSIKHGFRGAAHYKAAQEAEHKDSDAMRIGRLVHVMVFESYNWDKLAVSCPMEDGKKMPRNSKARKESWAEFEASIGDRDWYTPAELDQINAIAKAVHDNPEAQRWMLTGVAEVTGEIENSEHGLLKIRPDFRCSERRVIVDLKTTEDASIEAFTRTVINFHYDLSAGFYCDAAGAIEDGEPWRFIWIVAEKNPPHAVKCYDAAAWIELGREKYIRGLENIRAAELSGKWESYYADETLELEPPNWYAKKVLG